MKFLLSFAAVLAVAVAVPVQRNLVTPVAAGPAPIIDDNQEPIAIGPAVLEFEPISVGPAIVDAFEPISVGPAIVGGFEPISVGPAIVDFPLPETVVATPIQPSPVVIGPGGIISDSQGAPLVQIILNINQAAAESSPVAVAPVAVDDQPEPIFIVESAAEPVIVPSPVIIAPEPVIVVENEPIAVEPVIIGTPIIPAPAVTLPETLN